MTVRHLSAEEYAKKYRFSGPTRSFGKYPTMGSSSRPYMRDEIVSDWQNMVLGGKHGAHKAWCSMCRKLDVPNLLFVSW